jgi:NADPH:quinone reductase-like Zn-dependent oxidoreductase
MKAAIVKGPGSAPVYGDFNEPVPSGDEARIAVSAAAISHVVKSRVSGAHYSAEGRFPFIAGIDGVGRLADGRRVYFAAPRPPYGSMAEIAVASPGLCIDLPEGLDDMTAAAIANPGMSSWAALTERAKLLRGETVLINGATGTAGRLAVQIARHLGAKKVIATGRNIAALKSVAALGADATIPLGEKPDALEDAFKRQFAEGIDIVLDYLWGPSAECLLIAGAKAGREAVPIRFVQIGSSSATNINLPSAALRSSAIVMMGSGIGSLSLDQLLRATSGVLHAALPAQLKIEATSAPLSEVEQAWAKDDSARRTVFTIGTRASR